MKGYKSKITTVRNPEKYGLYVWITSDGKIFTDDDGNVMNIPSEEYDIEKIGKIRDAANYYGQGDGRPKFIAGAGRATDSEHQQDKERMMEGKIPLGDTQFWEEEMRRDNGR